MEESCAAEDVQGWCIYGKFLLTYCQLAGPTSLCEGAVRLSPSASPAPGLGYVQPSNHRQPWAIDQVGLLDCFHGQSEFWPVLPSFTGLRTDREPWQDQTGRPRHSHSIVSGTCKCPKSRGFLSGDPGLTVRNTVEKSRLKAIDGDRCRKQLPQVEESHPIAQEILDICSIKWNP